MPKKKGKLVDINRVIIIVAILILGFRATGEICDAKKCEVEGQEQSGPVVVCVSVVDVVHLL